MKKVFLRSALILSCGTGFLGACQPNGKVSSSQPLVTQVEHTKVKRQNIGNCWLYAAATWLESLLKSSDGRSVNVSETYWTYWDFFEKIMDGEGLDKDGKFPTGGHWWASTHLMQTYGWIEQDDFQPFEESFEQSSSMQTCAERDIGVHLQPGGRLHGREQRTEENVRAVLDEVFSCQGLYKLDWYEIRSKVRRAQDTALSLPGSAQLSHLGEQLDQWQVIGNPGRESGGLGKGLQSRRSREQLDALGIRIRRALNDRQPVVISFHVSFNAPDNNGLFNLDTLAERGDLGKQGGHMVVLHDYTVSEVPGFGSLGEGDMSPELKQAALQGQLETLVAKNSWGSYRWDRPWIGNGYSRFTWDYLKARYYSEEAEAFLPILQNVILPRGY